MLTVSASNHPLMWHVHKPADEKRMVVVLPMAGGWPVLRGNDHVRMTQGRLDVKLHTVLCQICSDWEAGHRLRQSAQADIYLYSYGEFGNCGNLSCLIHQFDVLQVQQPLWPGAPMTVRA